MLAKGVMELKHFVQNRIIIQFAIDKIWRIQVRGATKMNPVMGV